MRNSRRGMVDPFIVMDVMEAARRQEEAGHRVVHMEVGQPGTGAPDGARRAVAQALEAGPMGYTVALGLPELRTRIAALYRDWYGVDLSPERVVVTSGSSAGFTLAFTVLFEAGDRVAVGEPGYPSYRNILRALSLDPVGIQTQIQNRFQPMPSDISAIPDLKGLLVGSPANPTGTMLDREALAGLMSSCDARGICFISDEIYHGLSYDARAVSALEISDECVVINSFSKYFSMTGWRIGWMVVPEAMIRTFERLAQNMFICAPHVSQIAALAALDCEGELEVNREVYRTNRTLLLDGLKTAGFERIAPPDGAFYLYADVSDICDDSRRLAAQILEEAKVAVTPGTDFDPVRGGSTLRFSYAGPTADMREGLLRLVKWMAGRRAV